MDIDKGVNICTHEVSAYSSDERKDVYLSVAGQHTSLYTRDLCASEGGFEGHCVETSPPVLLVCLQSATSNKTKKAENNSLNCSRWFIQQQI